MKQIGIISLLMWSYSVWSGNDSSAIEGLWLNETGEYVVQIYHDSDIYNGRIVWLADSLDIFNKPLRDVMNNDPELRSRLVMGLNVLYGFEYDNEAWRHGKVYNFKNGNDYNAKLKLDDEGNLTWTGYYGLFFFLGKTKVWTKVEDREKYGLK